MTKALTYRAVLSANVPFRRVWLGEVISFLGDWFSLIALYTVVQTLTDSATAVAGVLVGKTLPVFLVTPLAGPLVDRLDRRKILLATDFGRALLAGGLMLAWELESLVLLYLSLSLQMALSGIFIPARTAVIAQLCDDEELPVAMALSGGTWSIMLALGAAIGGVLTEVVGIHGAFVLDGLTYLLSAVFLWGLPSLPPETTPDGDQARGFVHGLRYIASRPSLAATLLLKPAMSVQSAALVTLPMYGNGVFGATAGPMFIGLLYSARGFGALLGAMGTRLITGDSDQAMRRAIVPCFLLAGVSYALIARAPTFPLAALGFFVGAVGTGTIWVFAGTLAQRAAEGPFRGRVFAVEWGVMMLINAGAAYLAGVVMDGWGISPRELAMAMAFYMVIPAAVWPLLAGWAAEAD